MAIAHTQRRNRGQPVLEATQARSGRRGLHALWILVVSTGLAAIVLLALLAIQAPGLSGPGGQVTTNRPTVSAPLAPVKQTGRE
jgi:hypothetical protein